MQFAISCDKCNTSVVTLLAVSLLTRNHVPLHFYQLHLDYIMCVCAGECKWQCAAQWDCGSGEDACVSVRNARTQTRPQRQGPLWEHWK